MSLLPLNFSGSGYNNPSSNSGVSGSTVTRTASSPIQAFTEQIHTRVRGRQISFEISSDGEGVTWQLGSPRFDIRLDGRRQPWLFQSLLSSLKLQHYHCRHQRIVRNIMMHLTAYYAYTLTSQTQQYERLWQTQALTEYTQLVQLKTLLGACASATRLHCLIARAGTMLRMSSTQPLLAVLLLTIWSMKALLSLQ